MSATIEPEDRLTLEQQSDRRRSRPILLSPPSGDHVDARGRKEVVYLQLLPAEAGDRPYQHGYDFVGSASADDDCCDLELVGGGSWICLCPQLIDDLVVELLLHFRIPNARISPRTTRTCKYCR